MDTVLLFQETLCFKFFTALLLIKVSHCVDSDLEALVAIKAQLNSSAPAGWTGINPCNWTGIACESSNNAERVVKISLAQMNLTGTLDPGIGNLSFLVTLDLSKNAMFGPIPLELHNCQRLKVLNLEGNNFEGNFSGLFGFRNLEVLNLAQTKLNGSIPSTIGTLRNLRFLNLSGMTGLVGTIPDEIGNSSSLQNVDFSDGNLTGSIPSSLFQLKQLKNVSLSRNKLSGTLDSIFTTSSVLENLSLDENDFHGNIPEFFGNLSDLISLKASKNQFDGEIWPSSFTGLVKLEGLDLSENRLTGQISTELRRLTALQTLALNNNSLTGPIPGELFDCRKLTSLSLHNNRLSFEIPREIGNLVFLEVLQLQDNRLNGSIPTELVKCSMLKQINLSGNEIGGELPRGLSALAGLRRLHLSQNKLVGSIPSEYFSLRKIEYIVLSQNYLRGPIPNNLALMVELLNLELADNLLSGVMPSSLGELTKLQKLDLTKNQLVGDLGMMAEGINSSQLQFLLLGENGFTGNLSFSLDCMKGLLSLDLHGNNLSGNLPPAVGGLFQIQKIDLSSNHINGSIPPEFSDCSYLTFLNLSFNQFVGPIPAKFSKAWPSEITIDISNNLLSGNIPTGLNGSIVKLNVSNNGLEGSIPPSLQELGESSFTGNPWLCGPPLPTLCSDVLLSSSRNLRLSALITVVVVTACTITGVAVVLVIFRARLKAWFNRGQIGFSRELTSENGPVTWICDNRPSETCSNSSLIRKRLRQPLTYADLAMATGGFSNDNVLGDGGFGKVYKGLLKDGSTVAIKRLTEDGFQGEREFLAEMETLGTINHKNLVQLLGHCTSGLERLLVYDFMPNNSLDVWLHSRTEDMEPLPWPTRMNIAKDVARGLTFLHHFCIPHVIHRDLKASNILLDASFSAHLADFGLARYLNTYDSHVSTGVAGSLGYIAPEYAQSWRVTTRGDVFSYGVVLLELLSGKRPAGGCYKPVKGGNLVSWVRHLIQTAQTPILFDETISVEGFETKLMTTLEVALRCIRDEPSKRPSMLEVLRSLEDKL